MQPSDQDKPEIPLDPSNALQNTRAGGAWDEGTFKDELRSILAACSNFLGEEGPASGCPGAIDLADRAECMLSQVLIYQWKDEEDHNPDGFVHATPEQARAISEAVGRRFGPPPQSKALGALAHSLQCMGERSAEAGLHGNAAIVWRASRFVSNVEKAVTRLLPTGQGVRHATIEADLAVSGLAMRDDGRIEALCTDGLGGWWQLPVDELDPIFEIVAERSIRPALDDKWDLGTSGMRLQPIRVSGRTFVSPEDWGKRRDGLFPKLGVDQASPEGDETVHHFADGGFYREERPHAVTDPSVEGVGSASAVAIGDTVHHLSVDPDQEVHFHHPAFGQAAEMVGMDRPRERRRVVTSPRPSTTIQIMRTRFVLGLLVVVIVIAVLLIATHR